MTPAPDAPPAAQAPPDPRHLMLVMQIGAAHYQAQALSLAARLRIPDLLRDGPRSAEDLAKELGLHPPTLYRLLRGLAALGVFQEQPGQRFATTPVGQVLQTGPYSLRPLVAYLGHPMFWRACEHMEYTLRTGKASFTKDSGKNAVELINTDPQLARDVAEAMTSLSRIEAGIVARAYDFGRFAHIVDVGGGQGNLLCEVLRAHRSVRGTLVDQPATVEAARALFKAAGVADRATMVGGDFFKEVPAGGDAYVLSNVLHDWDDADCVRILRNVRRAMKPGQTLIVTEAIIPPEPAPPVGKILDLNLMLVGGKVRTSQEYEALFAPTGFRLKQVLPTPGASSFVIAEAV